MRRKTRQTDDLAVAEEPETLTGAMFAEAIRRHQAAELPQAEALYRAIIAIHTAPADASYNLGLLLQHQGRHAESLAAYRHAIAVRPDYAEAYSNLGTVLQDLRQFDDAIDIYRQAIARRPDFAMAYANLGTALKEVGRFDAAIAAYGQALRFNPQSDTAYANLGAVLLEVQRHADSVAACQQALAINPAMTMAHCNLAAAYKAQNALDAAAAAYRGAIAASPEYPEAHFGLAQILLLQGDLLAGWEEYEWRWKLREYQWLQNLHGVFTQPRWQGEPLHGRTVLVYAEQGLGDTIQFVRFVPEILRRGGRVVLAVHPPLVKLLDGMAGVTIVPLDAKLPDFDVHSPLLSLPRVFATDGDHIPAAPRYLVAEPGAVARWRQRVGGRLLRVGIVWAGNPGQRGDRLRSPHLAAMQPLFDIEGVDFVALQVGEGRQDLIDTPLPAHVLDLGAEITDFADTAAIMSGLDLVITSCTAPLHLAAALGIPTWAVIPFAPHFFWLLDRADSPWYPSLRLYRQDDPQDGWGKVMVRIGADLSRLAAAERADASQPAYA